MFRASSLIISKFALLPAWGKMLWTLYNDFDGSSAIKDAKPKMKCLWITCLNIFMKLTVHWPCAWVHHSSMSTSTVTPSMTCAEKEHLHNKSKSTLPTQSSLLTLVKESFWHILFELTQFESLLIIARVVVYKEHAMHSHMLVSTTHQS